MGYKAKIKQTRKSEIQNKLVWNRSGSSFSRPGAAAIATIKSDNFFKESLWTAWKDAALREKSQKVIGILYYNFPPAMTGVEDDFALFVSEQEFLRVPLVSREHVRCAKRFFSLFEPLVFESAGLAPPLYVMWADGEADGDCIADLCLSYPIELTDKVIEAGGKLSYF